MHRLRRLLTILAIAVPATVLAEPDRTASTNPATANGGPRVRPHDARSAALLLEGLRLSATLRGLVDRLEQRDVIVYVQMEYALKGRLAGSLSFITATETFRYVRVSISPNLRGTAAIATLGHELQHAVEVANEPSIVDEASLNAFYKHNGIGIRAQPNGWDTEAARVTGDEVRRDVTAARSSRVVESLHDFDPPQWHIVYRKARQGAAER